MEMDNGEKIARSSPAHWEKNEHLVAWAHGSFQVGDRLAVHDDCDVIGDTATAIADMHIELGVLLAEVPEKDAKCGILGNDDLHFWQSGGAAYGAQQDGYLHGTRTAHDSRAPEMTILWTSEVPSYISRILASL